MKITYERLPNCAVKFLIEIPAEETKAAYDKITRQLFTSVQIPGFRKGKAPKELALRFAGADKIRETVFEKVMEDSFKQALKEYPDLKIIGNLRSDDDNLLERFQVGTDFTYEVLVDVQPEIKLGQYKGFSLEVVKEEPDFSVIDQRLREYQINKSTLVPIDDRPAQTGDVVIMDMKAIDTETKEEVEYLEQEDWDFDLEEDTIFDEIYHALLGVRVGDVVEATISPSEKIGNNNPLHCVINVKDIKQRELPPLDDEFAQSISSKQTMTELREYLESVEIEKAEMRTGDAAIKQLLEQILAHAEIELPECMVEEGIERILNARLNELEEYVDPQTIKAMIEDEEMRSQLIEAVRPKAIQTEQTKLALLQVAIVEKISIPEEEVVRQEYQRLVKLKGKPSDTEGLKDAITYHLLQEKVVQFLKENNTIAIVSAKDSASEQISDQAPEQDSEKNSEQVSEESPVETDTRTEPSPSEAGSVGDSPETVQEPAQADVTESVTAPANPETETVS